MKFNRSISTEERRQEKQEFAIAFGHHLRKVRESKGISQEKLSIEAGYYHTYVNKIEAGKYSPSLHTVWRLAHTMKMTVSELLKGF
ncbi:helix-turn-helix transcriptional regulator [Candidatus Roizmanbacteria bacterium]|nr:MAG: helix-turn-helix transcriptional regulator [Candidatus Roizmanbacteria bacterium]